MSFSLTIRGCLIGSFSHLPTHWAAGERGGDLVWQPHPPRGLWWEDAIMKLRENGHLGRQDQQPFIQLFTVIFSQCDGYTLAIGGKEGHQQIQTSHWTGYKHQWLKELTDPWFIVRIVKHVGEKKKKRLWFTGVQWMVLERVNHFSLKKQTINLHNKSLRTMWMTLVIFLLYF